MTYKHTQVGYLMLFGLLVVVVLFAIVLSKSGFEPFITGIMFGVFFIIVSFSSLTVSVDREYVRLKFGYGIFKKKFQVKDIASVKSVKNKWYYGWGIRIWFWPYMLIYNVSGFDAVEIKMKNGRVYRIGTDEPKDLEQAVTQSCIN